MAVNQTGVFYGMQLAIEEMRTNGEKCSISNASSIEGLVAESAFFAYCATKGAVTLMTKAAALYCGEHRLPIRINSVHPGYVMTPMAYNDAQQNNQTIEEYSNEFIQKHPIGYLGKPEDIARILYPEPPLPLMDVIQHSKFCYFTKLKRTI
ncbi:MAG: SDR family oxidoreductase [Lachnospiraceae bacterium]